MAKPATAKGGAASVQKTRGFGVPTTSDPHHFQVIIPKANSGEVQIRECLGRQAQKRRPEVIDRVVLARVRWAKIRSEAQRAFNASLKTRNIKPSAWMVGTNLVDRLLGKELCVLAWAIEGMDLEKIQAAAVRNWLALRPEERWWLFGMTAMSTGGIKDGDKGWRMALRHALGDVAQSDPFRPPGRQAAQNTAQPASRPTLDLLGDETL